MAIEKIRQLAEQSIFTVCQHEYVRACEAWLKVADPSFGRLQAVQSDAGFSPGRRAIAVRRDKGDVRGKDEPVRRTSRYVDFQRALISMAGGRRPRRGVSPRWEGQPAQSGAYGPNASLLDPPATKSVRLAPRRILSLMAAAAEDAGPEAKRTKQGTRA